MKKLVNIYKVNGILDWYCNITANTKTKVKAHAKATQYALHAYAAPANPTAKSLHVKTP